MKRFQRTGWGTTVVAMLGDNPIDDPAGAIAFEEDGRARCRRGARRLCQITIAVSSPRRQRHRLR